uniref:Uncharacterized protein n=1 Tax=Lactuca sativa TaxID=4236 RepID=A0A9R1XTQ6_LACSA|nr:hypothetical protein LSAT_V11C100033520 [Lactuca sativa]
MLGDIDKTQRSLLVTGFGYEHDGPWAANMNLFKQFTDISWCVKRIGATVVDMCDVALGIVEAYWEYCQKPLDMVANVLVMLFNYLSLNLFKNFILILQCLKPIVVLWSFQTVQ